MTIRKTATVLALLMLGTAMPIYAQQTPAQQAASAARDAQLALDKGYAQLAVTEEVLPLRAPAYTMGESEGVAKNAAGHIFVYSRTGHSGEVFGGTAAVLQEWDENYKWVKEWMPDSYGASFAHAVRIDTDQNVWVVDEGSNMIMQYAPNGDIIKVLGRKAEAADWQERFIERKELIENRYPNGGQYTFNRPTDIAWSTNGDMYISDGYGNSRVIHMAKDGTWVKAVGTHGTGDGQFQIPHGIDVDKTTDTVYVADRNNNRIQVYDKDLNFKMYIKGIGAPWTVRVSPSYIYSGDGNTGKVYRIEKATGKVLGVAQTSLGFGQTGCLIHSLHVESDNVLYRGSFTRWDVSKITFK